MTKEQIPNVPDHLIEIEQKYHEYNYIYFAKSAGPFKTKGAYGFSHGGLTPQELLVPFVGIEQKTPDYNALKVTIKNKDKLRAVVGDYFKVTLNSDKGTGDAFSQSRKIYVAFIKSGKEFYQSDRILINANSKIDREFPIDKYNEFDLVILDAETITKLDSCKVEKIIARDLGGLGDI